MQVFLAIFLMHSLFVSQMKWVMNITSYCLQACCCHLLRIQRSGRGKTLKLLNAKRMKCWHLRQVLRKGAMLKGSSVTVTEDLSRWTWHLLFSEQLREKNLWKFKCWWDFVCCCWSVKVKTEHVAKVKVLMSGVFDNVEQSCASSCAMSKRETLLPRCYLLLSQFPLCQSLSCTAQCVLCQVRCHCIFSGPGIRYSDIFCVPCIT